jgi:putative two-component system response regulator
MQESKEKKIIFVIDDDKFFRTIANEALKDTYEVVVFEAGRELIEYFLDGVQPVPDLILMDIVMPEMDGWITYSRLKKIDTAKNIPVVILSSVSGTTATDHALEIGVNDYITKPCNIDDLLERIKKLIP